MAMVNTFDHTVTILLTPVCMWGQMKPHVYVTKAKYAYCTDDGTICALACRVVLEYI